MSAASNTKKTSKTTAKKSTRSTTKLVKKTTARSKAPAKATKTRKASPKATPKKTSSTKAVTNKRRGTAPKISGLDDLVTKPIKTAAKTAASIEGLPKMGATENYAFQSHRRGSNKVVRSSKLFATIAILFFVTIIAIGSVLFFGLFMMSEDEDPIPSTKISAYKHNQKSAGKVKIYGPPIAKTTQSESPLEVAQAEEPLEVSEEGLVTLFSDKKVETPKVVAAQTNNKPMENIKVSQLESEAKAPQTVAMTTQQDATIEATLEDETVEAADPLFSAATVAAKEMLDQVVSGANGTELPIETMENVSSVTTALPQEAMTTLPMNIEATAEIAADTSTSQIADDVETAMPEMSKTAVAVQNVSEDAKLIAPNNIEIDESTFEMFMPPAQALVGLNQDNASLEETVEKTTGAPQIEEVDNSLSNTLSQAKDTPRDRLIGMLQDKADLMNPQTQSWLEKQTVKGVVSRGRDSRMLLNSKIFLIGDIVDIAHKLVWVGIDAKDKRVYFKDGNGAFYSVNY